METLTRDISVVLLRELRAFRSEIELFPDDQSIWKTVPGITNSAGVLARHVVGNLRHFVGAVLGDSGYLRNRDSEFLPNAAGRAGIVAELGAAIADVEQVLPRLTADILEKQFPVVHLGIQPRTSLFLCHLATHTAFHLGQAGYVRRALLQDTRSSGGVSFKALGEVP